jgi:hypothetical protein
MIAHTTLEAPSKGERGARSSARPVIARYPDDVRTHSRDLPDRQRPRRRVPL